MLLLIELGLRFRYLEAFYSDAGTHPLSSLMPQTDGLYRLCCAHCLSGSLSYQRILLFAQCSAAASLAVGYRTRISAAVCWGSYFSLTLRNTWLAFILDRYLHYLMFYLMVLPVGEVWSVDSWLRGVRRRRRASRGDAKEEEEEETTTETLVISPATVFLKLQVLWIYLDAGYGKLSDPLGGWSYGANPLPALDTYARHTLPARYMYAMLGPGGLRLLTPTVVWAELLVGPVAVVGSLPGRRDVVWASIAVA